MAPGTALPVISLVNTMSTCINDGRRFELRTSWSRMGDTSIATAYDTLLEREVTLKRHECDDTNVQSARTLAEARAMSSTRHVLMLQVHDIVDISGEGLCLVLGAAMDRINGPPSIPSPLTSMLAPPMQTPNLKRRQSITAALAMVLLLALYVWTRHTAHSAEPLQKPASVKG